MKVIRSFGAAWINEVANHPEVFPHVSAGKPAPLDLAPIVADRRNVLLEGEYGSVLYYFRQPGLYDAHIQVLPEGRGKWAAQFSRATVSRMFCSTDAMEIVGRVPHGNVASRAITAMNGFTEAFGDGCFSLTIQAWMARCSGLDRLATAYDNMVAKMSGADPPSDAFRRRTIGIALGMARCGQPEKSVVFLNRWAAMTGGGPCRIAATRPLAIEFPDATVIVRDTGEFYVAALN